MTSPFPLFHVPNLPLARIIDFMEPNELVSLSFCSQKNHSVIKTLQKTPRDERLLVRGANIGVPFLSLTNFGCVLSTSNIAYISSSEKEEYVKLGGQKVRVKMALGEYLITYWEDKLNGLKAITDYVTDLFNIDLSEICVCKDTFKLIEHVNIKQKTPLEKVVYVDWSTSPSEDEMNYILRDCRCSSQICIYSEALPNFRFSNNFRRIDCLDISNSNWVTIDNLLSMDGIDIYLGKASLTNSDLNVFLRHWLSGGCPRLKLFSARTASVDLLQVLTGLLRNAVFVEGRGDYTSPFGYRSALSSGYDIQRADGVTATVCKQINGTLVIAVCLIIWIISVLFQTIKSLLIPNIPLPPPHFPPSQTVSIRQPDVPEPTSFPLLLVPYVPLRRIIDFMEPKTLVSLSFCSQKSHSVIKTQRKAAFNGRLCSSPFPLFRVPFVPLRRIINFMKADALVALSFCSQKSHSVIKTQRKEPFNGRLCVSERFDRNLSFRTFRNYDCVLSVSDCSYFSNSERSDYVKMNGQDVPVQVHRSDGNLVSYWRNKMDGLKTITDYVTNLYNIDVSEVCVSKNAIKLIKWVIRRQKTPLESVTVCGVTSSEEETIYILRDCETLSQIEIASFSPRNFRFSEKFRRIDFLDIWYGKWVTLDNLLTMDGIDIILGSSSLSNNDVNVFLEHWLSGGCPRLKLFCARIGTVDILQLLDGLMHNVVFVEDRRYYTSPFGYRRTLSFGYDIQRADGVTATVCEQENENVVIAVWPETTQNYN
ncbi:hypothetical protein CRE_30318 [Caenorhabditis remanei]|uniref:F-box domain-containing protein n=1 Tax=Caenorhabditis remanei TaxID=31234 RepID=E3NSI1_CAERE|nr:hypothetical protein CRE_30318 [Caenorhabditis remanei]